MVTRHSLKQNIMRNVTIRAIYDGVISIESFLEKEKEYFYKIFKRTFSRQDEISYNFLFKLQHVYGLISTKDDLEKQNTQLYKNDDYEGNEISLVINKYYLSLDIKCNNYKTIDPYLVIFFEILLRLKEHDKLLWIREVGIKKNSSEVYSNLEKLFRKFKKEKVIAGDFSNEMLKNIVLQKIMIPKGNIDISKKIEKGNKISENNQREEAYRIQFDFDGEINELDEIPFEELKEETIDLNDKLFELFIENVTSEFIEIYSKKLKGE